MGTMTFGKGELHFGGKPVSIKNVRLSFTDTFVQPPEPVAMETKFSATMQIKSRPASYKAMRKCQRASMNKRQYRRWKGKVRAGVIPKMTNIDLFKKWIFG